MHRPASLLAAFAILALALLNSCSLPTYDPEKQRAIRTEAQALMARYPISRAEQWADVSKGGWPPVIASLDPYRVTVHSWGVNIWVKPYFDGGWGYHVATNKRDLPLPENCYSELSQAVFWHGPCL